jgi:hypothetical protein
MMGAEFLSRTRKTIVKHIDAKRVALATADLLTNTPKDQPRRSIASVAPGASVNTGETIIVEARGGKLSARRGNAVVANFDNPGSDLIAAIGKAGGVTTGVVQRVHKLSKKVEVSL